MKVEINHPHAEAIAAFYSGRRVRHIASDGFKSPWMERYVHTPVFSPSYTYQIEPEVTVKYCALLQTERSGTTIGVDEFDSKHDVMLGVWAKNSVGSVKKTYTDGVLTAIEIVKE